MVLTILVVTVRTVVMISRKRGAITSTQQQQLEESRNTNVLNHIDDNETDTSTQDTKEDEEEVDAYTRRRIAVLPSCCCNENMKGFLTCLAQYFLIPGGMIPMIIANLWLADNQDFMTAMISLFVLPVLIVLNALPCCLKSCQIVGKPWRIFYWIHLILTDRNV